MSQTQIFQRNPQIPLQQQIEGYSYNQRKNWSDKVGQKRCLCNKFGLCYCHLFMSRQQQDKSKGKSAFSPTPEALYHFDLATTLSLTPSTLPLPSYFDKFKYPTYRYSSAFRLCQPVSSSEERSSQKKNEIIRKHRGNYRKYTVAEKEEAVKQILEGVDAKQISQRYGIPRRNLLRWKKNGCERKEGGGRPTDGQMELTLYTKIDNKTLLTEKDIRAEAKRLSKMADFKASKGWYCKFSRRFNQWKKQQRDKAIKREGGTYSEEKDVFLLPEVSMGSDSDDEDEEDSLQHSPPRQQSD